MSNDRYIPGVPCWVDTTREDPEATAAFYGGLFGWELEDVMPAGSPGRYLVARLDGGDVAAIGSRMPGEPAAPPAWDTYVWVEDASAAADAVLAAGGTVVLPPTASGDAGRMAIFADREGALVRVWEPAGHRGATVVNVHGSVNFNDLHAADPEAAKAFYGEVFGWRTLEWGGGAATWLLPGYGRFLDGSVSPGMLEGMEAMGAPAGFEDAVATLVPLQGAGATPHWGVTFGVDDADAAAERAHDLGGRVLQPPADGPWVRTTTIADPEGVAFVASQFVPENRDVAAAGSGTAAA